MISLAHLTFIDMDGEPITGQAPVRLFVSGDLTGHQSVQAEAAFTRFKSAVETSIAPLHQDSQRLDDGGRIVMWAHERQYLVQIWAAGARVTELPHAIIVRPAWLEDRAIVYRRTISDQGVIEWIVDERSVPQAIETVTAYNSVEYLPSGDEPLFHIHPMVGNSGVVWDFSLHGGLLEGVSSEGLDAAVPIGLRIDPGYEEAFDVGHFIHQGLIKDAAGATLYTLAPPSPILIFDPESVVKDPGSTTGDGKEAILANHRSAYIASQTFVYHGNWVRLKRTADATYAVLESGNSDIWSFPRNDIATNGGEFGPTSKLSERDPSTGKWSTKYFRLDRSGHYSATVGSTLEVSTKTWTSPGNFITLQAWSYQAYWGVTATTFMPGPQGDEEDPSGVTFAAFTKGYGQDAGSPTVVEKVLAVPGQTGAEYVSISRLTAFPVNGIIRGGTSTTTVFSEDYFGDSFPPRYWINTQKSGRIDKVDLTLDATGTTELRLGWTTVDMLKLIGSGTATGGWNKDTRVGQTNIEYAFADAATLSDYVPTDVEGDQAWYSNAYPATVKTGYEQERTWRAGRGSIHDEILRNRNDNDGTKEVSNAVTRCHNHVDYTYTSEYVIDYDHRMRFVAFIRVTVGCTGYHYSDEASPRHGFITTKHADPTYTVTIEFVTRWQQTAGAPIESTTQLAQESVVRPAFELYVLPSVNPFLYPSYEADIYPLNVKGPPRISTVDKALTQLSTLSSHQGVNPHLAGQPYLASMDAWRSPEGVEVSTLSQHGDATRHVMYPSGMVYGRTFKTSDFSDALWLLTATKCDTNKDDNPYDPNPQAYYYFPGLLAAMNATRRIEVRDGELVQWSDAFVDANGNVPAFTSRQTKLYRV